MWTNFLQWLHKTPRHTASGDGTVIVGVTCGATPSPTTWNYSTESLYGSVCDASGFKIDGAFPTTTLPPREDAAHCYSLKCSNTTSSDGCEPERKDRLRPQDIKKRQLETLNPSKRQWNISTNTTISFQHHQFPYEHLV